MICKFHVAIILSLIWVIGSFSSVPYFPHYYVGSSTGSPSNFRLNATIFWLKAALGKQSDESEDEVDPELEEQVASDTISYSGMKLEKGYIGCGEEKYGRCLSVAVCGNKAITDSMIDPQRNDGRSPAHAEGVDVFRR